MNLPPSKQDDLIFYCYNKNKDKLKPIKNMALVATHIRFALYLKDEYKIRDIEKYISGTIYPDSRYITKIDRELTHGGYILNPKFAKDDFKKGWQVHLICDLIQNYIARKNIQPLKKHPLKSWPEDKWIDFTSIKIIQNRSDMQYFNLQNYLKYLEYVNNPNGEEMNKIKKFNQIIITLYKDKKVISVEDDCQLWLAFGLSEKLGLKVKKRTMKYLADKKLVKQVGLCYNKMIKSYKTVLP